ncbi:hypothetical protein P8452_09387 [Trifolium repens]|nr:hypothetical protein P8452_09387 [Trifolium repens]
MEEAAALAAELLGVTYQSALEETASQRDKSYTRVDAKCFESQLTKLAHAFHHFIQLISQSTKSFNISLTHHISLNGASRRSDSIGFLPVDQLLKFEFV